MKFLEVYFPHDRQTDDVHDKELHAHALRTLILDHPNFRLEKLVVSCNHTL
ncbi:11638_t:CDS:2 [Funneliformis mosseae]|uniref:11638_t:CDS:1 n=1 Tax=Funneliformis mosseae TaxID=27381 RepID=A0A9N9GHQ8_FUNMO|nr:11638_t:CDS:2 [Funneliformis mosseae]